MSTKSKTQAKDVVQMLVDRSADWQSGTGPEAIVAPSTSGRLMRNLADFPFPGQCSEDEKAGVQDRVLGGLEHAGYLKQGQYCLVDQLDGRSARVLRERGIISDAMVEGTGARGVFIHDDQSLTVAVNDTDHVQIQVRASGLQPQEVWSRLNAVDDALSAELGFAFDEELGYLTAVVSNVGTGLRMSVVLHLPGLVAANALLAIDQELREQRHLLDGVYGSVNEARGDLFTLSNGTTLGRSEEEIVYTIRHAALDLIEREHHARRRMLEDSPRSVEDRVGRALGTARGAHVLEFNEAVGLLSSLRLGLALDMGGRHSLETLNELEMLAQPGHLELTKGGECDSFQLGAARADLFRARLS